jgi:thymidylate synthase
MQTFYTRNVSEALFLGLQALKAHHREVETRNGLALEFLTPVCTTYTHPKERVLFYPERDANPFFHLMESFWMLAGRNDVEWISKFNGRINNYSDDGTTFHGAYGFRWKKWFDYDQIERIVMRLKTYPNDRRSVLSMWDPKEDLVTTNDGKDYPCNTQIFFSVRDFDEEEKEDVHKVLDMTVINRSNDMIWGAYGANAVHMSILQEYVAGKVGCNVGRYYQVSNNLHAYKDVFEKLLDMGADYEPYLTIGKGGLKYTPIPLITNIKTFDEELIQWFRDEDRTEYENIYLGTTASRVRKSWRLWKRKEINESMRIASTIEDRAWRKACAEWLLRREPWSPDW